MDLISRGQNFANWGYLPSSRGLNFANDQTHEFTLDKTSCPLLYHWSTEETMIHLCAENLDSLILKTKEEIGLLPKQEALLIYDIFAAHRTMSFKNILYEYNIIAIFVLASCTSDLQPLDMYI